MRTTLDRWTTFMTSVFAPIPRGPERTVWVFITATAVSHAMGVALLATHPEVAGPAFLLSGVGLALAGLRTGWLGACRGVLLMAIAGFAGSFTTFLVSPDLLPAAPILALCLLLTTLTALLFGARGADLLEKRALEAARLRAERRASDLEADFPLGILLLDRGGRIRRSNRAARRLLYTESPEEFGISLQTLVSPASWPGLRDRLFAPSAERPCFVTVDHVEPLVTEWTLTPALDEGPGMVRAILRDASDARRMEGETRALAAALRAMHDGVVMTDLDGQIRYANPAALRLWGIADRTALLGTAFAALVAPEDRQAFAARLVEARSGSNEHECRLVRSDGAACIAIVTLTPVRVAGEEIAVAAVIKDVTATRTMERQASAVDHRAALGRLVAGAAHDISDPLTAIIGTVDILEHAAELPWTLRGPVEVIRAASHRAGKVVHDLVEFAQQAPQARSSLDLAEVVGRAVAIRRNYAATAGIDLTFHAPSPAPVTIDVDRVYDAVLELLVNAEAAVAEVAEKRISVTIGRRGGHALLMVNDSGPGIPAEVAGRIFDPFFSERASGPQAGVGLAMVAGVVGAHGGTISVARGVLGGAQFALEFPLAAAAPSRVTEPTVHRPNDLPTALDLLVVDDEPEVLATMGRVLRRAGHRVQLAATGESAVRLARTQHVDVVISDLRMPGMSGRQLHAKLTAEGILPAAEFVVSTGDGADPEAVAFLQATGLPVLHKPFEISELLEMLKRFRPAQRQVEIALERAG